jgi:hypothetical protein
VEPTPTTAATNTATPPSTTRNCSSPPPAAETIPLLQPAFEELRSAPAVADRPCQRYCRAVQLDHRRPVPMICTAHSRAANLPRYALQRRPGQYRSPGRQLPFHRRSEIEASSACQNDGAIVFWWEETEGGGDPSRRSAKSSFLPMRNGTLRPTISSTPILPLLIWQEVFDVGPCLRDSSERRTFPICLCRDRSRMPSLCSSLPRSALWCLV